MDGGAEEKVRVRARGSVPCSAGGGAMAAERGAREADRGPGRRAVR